MLTTPLMALDLEVASHGGEQPAFWTKLVHETGEGNV